MRTLLVLFALAAPAAAGDWPGWRGPTGMGQAPDKDLPVELPGDQLASAARQARLLSTVVPRLSPRVDAFIRRLEAAVPTDDLVTSHGGFHGSQILRDNGEVGVVDFDGMCLAPPALDIASYVASLVETSDDLDRAGEALDVLVGSYGARPPGVSWYLAARLFGGPSAESDWQAVQPAKLVCDGQQMTVSWTGYLPDAARLRAATSLLSAIETGPYR